MHRFNTLKSSLHRLLFVCVLLKKVKELAIKLTPMIFLAVLITGNNMFWVKSRAQKVLSLSAEWTEKPKLQFSTRKTEIVKFTHMGESFPGIFE